MEHEEVLECGENEDHSKLERRRWGLDMSQVCTVLVSHAEVLCCKALVSKGSSVLFFSYLAGYKRKSLAIDKWFWCS
jgi:hypothetical protein